MFQDRYQRALIALIALIILLMGTFLGNYLLSKLSTQHLQSMLIGLQFTNIVVILITCSLVIEIRKLVEFKKR